MDDFYVGQRLSYESQLCTLRYIGEVKDTKGQWLGVEWDDASRGKHSGENKGIRYFDCKVEGAGSFVRPNRPFDPPRTFLTGLKRKYVTNIEESGISKPIEFGTKIAEEVGFDKVSKKFSELDSLRRVLLDYMCVKTCDEDSDEITRTCPNISELDLTCNLFEDIEQVAKICLSLPKLYMLFINGNRFAKYEVAESYITGFSRIKILRAEDLRMTWEELFLLVNNFTNVTDLSIAVGDIQMLRPEVSPRIRDLHMAGGLESLCLEENAIESLSDLADLQGLPSLRRLLLSRNKIKTVGKRPAGQGPAAESKLCFPQVTYLDLSRNEVAEWSFLDDMRDAFPKLEAVRTSQNPLYGAGDFKALTEEAFQLTVARLDGKVTSLNYSVITPAERADAELFYISTIVKQLSESPVEQEKEILAGHTRWQKLQELHGERAINRNPTSKSRDALASKLIEVELSRGSKTITKKFPRTITIGKLSGLVGRLVGANPLDISLSLIEEGLIGSEGTRKTQLSDELRELDYYVTGDKAKLVVNDR